MKTRKTKFIIEQIIFALFIPYIFVIEDDFIYCEKWAPTFAFAIAFYHIGTFSSLYATLTTKTLSKEKEQLLFNFNMFIYTGFLALCLYHNCVVKTNHLMQSYLFLLFILIYVVIFIFETVRCVNNYKVWLLTKK